MFSPSKITAMWTLSLERYRKTSSVLSNLFIQMVKPLEMTPGGPSDKRAQMAQCSNVRAETHNKYCHCWRMRRGKVCRAVISLPTHARPVSESHFLVFGVCVSVFMQLHARERERERAREQERECVPDTESLVFSSQAADFSTIISWIVLRAQHLSQTHTNIAII